MKGIVLEIKDKHAIVLSKNGEFIKVPSMSNLDVGSEIDINEIKSISFRKVSKIASIAAIFIFVIGMSLGVYSYYIPYTYIDVDINPSIEITANMYNRILNVEGINEDGKNLINGDIPKYKNLNEGIEKILDRAIKEGYIREEYDNAVMFTVSGKNEVKTKELSEKVQNVAEIRIKNSNNKSQIIIENVTVEEREEARNLGVSPGKLILSEKLINLNPEINVDEVIDLPVRDIVKSIKEESNKKVKEEKEDKDRDKDRKIEVDKNTKVEDDFNMNNDGKDRGKLVKDHGNVINNKEESEKEIVEEKIMEKVQEQKEKRKEKIENKKQEIRKKLEERKKNNQKQKITEKISEKIDKEEYIDIERKKDENDKKKLDKDLDLKDKTQYSKEMQKNFKKDNEIKDSNQKGSDKQE